MTMGTKEENITQDGLCLPPTLPPPFQSPPLTSMFATQSTHARFSEGVCYQQVTEITNRMDQPSFYHYWQSGQKEKTQCKQLNVCLWGDSILFYYLSFKNLYQLIVPLTPIGPGYSELGELLSRYLKGARRKLRLWQSIKQYNTDFLILV